MLHEMLTGKAAVFVHDHDWERFLNKLGLTAKPTAEVFGAEGKGLEFQPKDGKSPSSFVPPIEVHTIRPAFRAGREGRQIEQVLITLTQQVRVDLGTKKHPNVVVFRGGCSLILGLGQLDTAEYVVVKRITSYRRFRAQVDYLTGESGPSPNLTMYTEGRGRRISFRLLHR